MISREQLLTVDVEKLADMLLTLYANNKDMHKQMDLLFAGLLQDDTALFAAIKKELSSLKRSTSFIDYYQADALANRIDELRMSIVSDLQEKSPEKAMQMMHKLLDESIHTLERADDSNGIIQSIFIQATEDFGQIAQKIKQPIENLVDVIFTIYFNSEFIVSDTIITSCKDALGKDGLLLLKKQFLDSMINHDDHKINRGLKDIADCLNDVDGYIKTCTLQPKPKIYDCIEIAKRLVKNNRPDEALSFIAIVMQSDDDWYKEKAFTIKIDALECKGDATAAQNERINYFNTTLDCAFYDQILQHMQPELHDDFIKIAIKKAFIFDDVIESIEFLTHVKNLDALSDCINSRIDAIDGNNYYTLRPVADTLSASHPLTATLLYRKMLESVLEKASSKYYDYAAKDLTACLFLSPNIVDWQSHDNHEIYFQKIAEIYKRRPSFWATYQLILQKKIAKQTKKMAKKK